MGLRNVAQNQHACYAQSLVLKNTLMKCHGAGVTVEKSVRLDLSFLFLFFFRDSITDFFILSLSFFHPCLHLLLAHFVATLVWCGHRRLN